MSLEKGISTFENFEKNANFIFAESYFLAISRKQKIPFTLTC